VRLPPEDFRHLRAAYQRRDVATVAASADAVAARLNASPRDQVFIPALALMKGEALLELERYVEAHELLQEGVRRLVEGQSYLHELGPADRFRLLLVELEILLGRYGDAWQRLLALEEPDRPPATRLGALRARARLNTIRGDYEGAHHLLNAATSVTDRINSRFMVALVEVERAVVLATQGRLHEAIALADRLHESLGAPLGGRRGAWAARLTAGVSLWVSRLAHEAGRAAEGDRLLLRGAGAVARAPTRYLEAHRDVAISTQWRVEGRAGSAEPVCREAMLAFERLGARPAAATATLELARIAVARGLATSAQPLADRARAEFSFLGHARELHEATAVLRELHAAG
jgi:tetratricopeptide (TPR) repeat protein